MSPTLSFVLLLLELLLLFQSLKTMARRIGDGSEDITGDDTHADAGFVHDNDDDDDVEFVGQRVLF